MYFSEAQMRSIPLPVFHPSLLTHSCVTVYKLVRSPHTQTPSSAQRFHQYSLKSETMKWGFVSKGNVRCSSLIAFSLARISLSGMIMFVCVCVGHMGGHCPVFSCIFSQRLSVQRWFHRALRIPVAMAAEWKGIYYGLSVNSVWELSSSPLREEDRIPLHHCSHTHSLACRETNPAATNRKGVSTSSKL